MFIERITNLEISLFYQIPMQFIGRTMKNLLQIVIYLFIVTCINKVTDLPIYSYKNKLGGCNVVKEKEIQLPVDENDKIDFSYMEIFIQTTKKRYLKNLVFYVNNNL